MKLITELKDLIPGEEYWTRSKGKDAVVPPRIMVCSEKHTGPSGAVPVKYLAYRGSGMCFWATENNNQATELFDIIGPVPKQIPPDFEEYKAKALEEV